MSYVVKFRFWTPEGKAQVEKRYMEVYEMRKAGATYKAIGDAFGFSYERARQIVKRIELRKEQERFRLENPDLSPLPRRKDRENVGP